MKNIFKRIIVSFIIALAFLISTPIMADPPGTPGSHGSNGDEIPGGGAPVGGGLIIMMALGAAYGSKKVYAAFK